MTVENALKRLNYFRLKHKLSLKEERMLETLADAVTVWHPFPAEKPSEEEKEYIVTVESETIGLFTICSEWQGKEGGWAGVFDEMVKAWAELPMPYKEEA